MSGVIRPMSRMKKIDSKETLFRTRKRNLRYLVLAFLKQEGYFQTAETFYNEAGLTDEFEVCDNIDLDIIMQEYCTYYITRFDKQPQFCRKIDDKRPNSKKGPRRPPTRAKVEELKETPSPDLPSSFNITQLVPEEDNDGKLTRITTIERKSLAAFLTNSTPEKKQIAELLYQDIIKPLGVKWEEIKGLENVKSILKESVVYPAKYPEVFTGPLEPWKGVLLHGPPGTGKTMLAKAVANESNCTFFNVSCSTMINKWRGESEKIVKVLFEMAYYYAPSIIFVDEVESLMSDRSAPGEHEASRRFKSQLLTELDGIGTDDGSVFLLANSNMPWEIDTAMLRRLEKRIHIPLPDYQTRIELFTTYLDMKNNVKVDFDELAARTEGYSGSDIKLVCKEALMATVRNLFPNMNKKNQMYKNKLELEHLLTAISKTKPVSKNLAQRHLQWQNEMGSS